MLRSSASTELRGSLGEVERLLEYADQLLRSVTVQVSPQLLIVARLGPCAGTGVAWRGLQRAVRA